MELILTNKSGEDIRPFVEDLMNKIKKHFLNSLNTSQIKRVDDYLNSSLSPLVNTRSNRGRIKWSARNILLGAIQNLTYSRANETYRVFVDPNKNIPNTNLSYSVLLSLIDQGNLSLSPYPIWTNTVKYFDKEAPTLYNEYRRTGE